MLDRREESSYISSMPKGLLALISVLLLSGCGRFSSTGDDTMGWKDRLKPVLASGASRSSVLHYLQDNHFTLNEGQAPNTYYCILPNFWANAAVKKSLVVVVHFNAENKVDRSQVKVEFTGP